MIKIEKKAFLLLSSQDPDLPKIKNYLLDLLNRYPELAETTFFLDVNKLNEEHLKFIRNLNEIATGKKEAKLPVFALSVNLYTYDIDAFIDTLRKLNFTNKKRGLILNILTPYDPQFEYQTERLNEIMNIYYEDIENGRIIPQILPVEDPENIEKNFKNLIEKINEKIYGEKGLKLPVFAASITYSTNGIVEFASFLDNLEFLNT